jgi:hypothetical protein
MRQHTTYRMAAALVAVSLAGCGGGGGDDAGKRQAVQLGGVLYRDALADNDGGWLVVDKKAFFDGGHYEWRDLPTDATASAAADDLLAMDIPQGVAVSAAVEMREGAALRAVACRELGPRDDQAHEWYDLGIDGRQALIRRGSLTAPPKVLARTKASVPNGRRVRLTGVCVPDRDGGLVLVLRVDGREVARARDPKPLPAARDGLVATPSIRATRRPDSPGRASLVWSDFELRSATVAAR